MTGRSTLSRSSTRWIRRACAEAVQMRWRGRSVWPNPGRSMAMTGNACELINEAADEEVLGHGAVAVDQDYVASLAACDVVDAQPISRRTALGIARLLVLERLYRLDGLPHSLAALSDRSARYLGRGFQDLGKLGSASRSPSGDAWFERWEQGGFSELRLCRGDRAFTAEALRLNCSARQWAHRGAGRLCRCLIQPNVVISLSRVGPRRARRSRSVAPRSNTVALALVLRRKPVLPLCGQHVQRALAQG